MDHANAVLDGQEQPTVEDFIEWIEEECVRMGMLGFRTEYADPEEIFAYSAMNASGGELDTANDLEQCATVEMMRVDKEIAMMERRMHIMRANKPLLARTEVHVDKALLAAGKTQEDINSYPNNEKRLHKKVMDLYTLKHPIPPITGPPRGVDAVLVLGEKLDRQVSVTLPVKATLAEVCKLLDGTCASEDYLTVGWHKPPAEKRIWKYHLIAKGQKSPIAPHSTKLLTDADYNHLIQQVQKKEKDGHPRFAILTVVSRLFKRPDD